MKTYDMPDEFVIAETLFNKYQMKSLLNNKIDHVELNHHLDLNKLKISIDESMQKHGRHPWQSADGSQMRYSGFSLTFNPEHQDQLNPNASSLGTPKNKKSEFFYNSTQNHKFLKNSYFDTYGFIQRTPAASYGYLSELLNSCQRTIIRSRMMILDGNMFDEKLIEEYKTANIGDSNFGWHRDEPITVNLRINIPITGNDAFVFEMANETPYVLKTGKAYTWDTHKPHRVWCRHPTSLERYNLIIGVSPWFDYFPDTQEWLPNQYFGVKNPIEMVQEGLVFDWLRSDQ